MTTRRHALILAIALLAIVTMGCQGGSAREADDTAQQISGGQLARMVLDLEDLGPEYTDFEADAGNGFRTFDQAADDDFDTEDQRADLERSGWASSYQEFYTSARAASEGSGLFAVGSGVDLFDTAEGAEGYFEDSRAELTTLVGVSSEGVTVLDIQEFDADIADGAVGALLHGRIEIGQGTSYPIWEDVLMLRHGRLVATVGCNGYEERPCADTLRELASQLDQKIGSTLGVSAAAR